MTRIAQELDEKLKGLDAATARNLEQLVRAALESINSGTAKQAAPSELPASFFTSIAAEFGPEPFERPPQGAFESARIMRKSAPIWRIPGF